MPEITEREFKLFEILKKIFIHAVPDKSGAFYICGEGGEKDLTGLPERIMVCPAYGADPNTTKIYRRVDMENDTVTISNKEYLELLRDREMLDALHENGVDNWEYYGDALQPFYKKWLDGEVK